MKFIYSSANDKQEVESLFAGSDVASTENGYLLSE
jgi:hypothetical protein